MEYGLRHYLRSTRRKNTKVLILVLMEYGLRLADAQIVRYPSNHVLILVLMEYGLRLSLQSPPKYVVAVLILVLMEYGLRLYEGNKGSLIIVLILVLMEYGLRR